MTPALAGRACAPRRVVAGLVALAVIAGAGAEQADAAGGIRKVCGRAILRDAPNGIPIGVLERGQTVRVVRRNRGRTWVEVELTLPAEGWIKIGMLCGKR